MSAVIGGSGKNLDDFGGEIFQVMILRDGVICMGGSVTMAGM